MLMQRKMDNVGVLVTIVIANDRFSAITQGETNHLEK